MIILKKKEKDSFQELLKNLSIEEFIWKIYLNNLIDQIHFATKFEKKFRNLCQSIKDQTLKKYILEYYLEKIKKFNSFTKKQ